MKSTQRAEGGSIDFWYARKISLSTNYYTCVTKYFSCVVWGVSSKRFALSLHHDVGLVDKSRFGLFPKSLVDDWLLIEDVSSTRDRKQSIGRNILLSYHGGENRRHPSTMGTREQLCPLTIPSIIVNPLLSLYRSCKVSCLRTVDWSKRLTQ